MSRTIEKDKTKPRESGVLLWLLLFLVIHARCRFLALDRIYLTWRIRDISLTQFVGSPISCAWWFVNEFLETFHT
jgi:hypothetical protein